MNHLSDYALDALAAGRTTPEKAAHLASCLHCQARWAELESADAHLRLNPKFGTTREFAMREVSDTRRSRRFKLLVAAPLAAGAMAALVLFQPTWSSLRSAKSPSASPKVAAVAAPSLEVVRVDGAGRIQAGDRVVFEVTAPGAHHALMMAIDESGAVSQVWPASGAESGTLGSGRITTLTPGSWAPWRASRVELLLSQRTLNASDFRRAFAEARAAQPGASVRSLAIGALPGETGRLSSFIEVQPRSAAGQPLGAPR